KIGKILSDRPDPPSLKELAESVGVSVGYLSYRYPVLSKNVVIKHKKHADEAMRMKRSLALAKALDYFVSEKYGYVGSSRKQAYKILREETGLPKFVLKSAIQKAYE